MDLQDIEVWALDASSMIQIKLDVPKSKQWCTFKILESLVKSGVIAIPPLVIYEVQSYSHPDAPGVGLMLNRLLAFIGIAGAAILMVALVGCGQSEQPIPTEAELEQLRANYTAWKVEHERLERLYRTTGDVKVLADSNAAHRASRHAYRDLEHAAYRAGVSPLPPTPKPTRVSLPPGPGRAGQQGKDKGASSMDCYDLMKDRQFPNRAEYQRAFDKCVNERMRR